MVEEELYSTGRRGAVGEGMKRWGREQWKRGEKRFGGGGRVGVHYSGNRRGAGGGGNCTCFIVHKSYDKEKD